MSTSPNYDEALPFALLRAREATLARFRAHVTENGLTLEQWRVIRALAEHEHLETWRLSELCVLLPPSLSRILKTLEARDLVAVQPGKDRRTKTSRLTTSGRALFDTMIPRTREIHGEIEGSMGTEDLSTLVALLSRLRERLDPQAG